MSHGFDGPTFEPFIEQQREEARPFLRMLGYFAAAAVGVALIVGGQVDPNPVTSAVESAVGVAELVAVGVTQWISTMNREFAARGHSGHSPG